VDERAEQDIEALVARSAPLTAEQREYLGRLLSPNLDFQRLPIRDEIENTFADEFTL
jgi:hypothetical protein